MSDSDSPPFHQTIVLVGRAQDADPEALQELFARYLPRVRRIVALRLGRQQHEILDIDDITQDAMADAIRGLSRFSADSDASFINWLSQIVVNRIRMELRRANTGCRGSGEVLRFADAESSVHDSEVKGTDRSPLSHAVESEAQDKLSQALHRLTEAQREIVIQRAHCHMTYAEIATSMDFPNADAARGAFNKALKELKVLMRGDASES